MLNSPFQVQPFSLMLAAGLIGITFLIGCLYGVLFYLIKNKLFTRAHMSALLLLLSPALFGLFWIIRFQICAARRRRLVDTFGIDPKKLRKMSCKEVTKLRSLIEDAQDKGDAYALESAIRPYRP